MGENNNEWMILMVDNISSKNKWKMLKSYEPCKPNT